MMREITFSADDGVRISASFATPGAEGADFPAVILIHEGESDRSEWGEFFDKILRQDFVVLSYDIRGHGASEKVADLDSLYNDSNQAPRDLVAAISFLRSDRRVDSSRIGIVGASLGGNLACVGSSELGVKTAVVISAKTTAAQNLAGKEELGLRSVFYIASEGDEEGQRAQWAKELHGKTQDPAKIKIVAASSAHGVNIFEDLPEVEEEILEWLRESL
jgi:dienelactone hydrolase